MKAADVLEVKIVPNHALVLKWSHFAVLTVRKLSVGEGLGQRVGHLACLRLLVITHCAPMKWSSNNVGRPTGYAVIKTNKNVFDGARSCDNINSLKYRHQKRVVVLKLEPASHHRHYPLHCELNIVLIRLAEFKHQFSAFHQLVVIARVTVYILTNQVWGQVDHSLSDAKSADVLGLLFVNMRAALYQSKECSGYSVHFCFLTLFVRVDIVVVPCQRCLDCLLLEPIWVDKFYPVIYSLEEVQLFSPVFVALIK